MPNPLTSKLLSFEEAGVALCDVIELHILKNSSLSVLDLRVILLSDGYFLSMR